MSRRHGQDSSFIGVEIGGVCGWDKRGAVGCISNLPGLSLDWIARQSQAGQQGVQLVPARPGMLRLSFLCLPHPASCICSMFLLSGWCFHCVCRA